MVFEIYMSQLSLVCLYIPVGFGQRQGAAAFAGLDGGGVLLEHGGVQSGVGTRQGFFF